MEELKYLRDMLRVGRVMDVDKKGRRARVIYTDAQDPSGWLWVLASPPFMPDEETDPQRTEPSGSHVHQIKITPWLPRINDTVLCVFVPVFNGDGFILGRIG